MQSPTVQTIASVPKWSSQCTIMKRLTSFISLVEPEMSIEQLAASFGMSPDRLLTMTCAGFFLVPQTSTIACFHCGISFSHWDRMRFPYLDHALASPTCDFIIAQLGDTMIQQLVQQIQGEDFEHPQEKCSCVALYVCKYLKLTDNVHILLRSIPF